MLPTTFQTKDDKVQYSYLPPIYTVYLYLYSIIIGNQTQTISKSKTGNGKISSRDFG